MNRYKNNSIVYAIQVTWANWSELVDKFSDRIIFPATAVDDCAQACGEQAPYIALRMQLGLEGYTHEDTVRHGDWIINPDHQDEKRFVGSLPPEEFERIYVEADKSFDIVAEQNRNIYNLLTDMLSSQLKESDRNLELRQQVLEIYNRAQPEYDAEFRQKVADCLLAVHGLDQPTGRVEEWLTAVDEQCPLTPVVALLTDPDAFMESLLDFENEY